jgi:gas vesicle protein
MTQTEHPQMEHPRNGGLTLFLAFAGGALAGGVAAMLFAPRSGAETRRRITGAMGDTKELASRMPQAIREASSAAQAAFAAAMNESAGRDATASGPNGSPPSHRP